MAPRMTSDIGQVTILVASQQVCALRFAVLRQAIAVLRRAREADSDEPKNPYLYPYRNQFTRYVNVLGARDLSSSGTHLGSE